MTTLLKNANPELFAQLLNKKNSDINVDLLKQYSHNIVWWRCVYGHEWQATVYSRSAGQGCPFCSRKKVIVGETDLATVNPVLAAQWHPIKNGELYSTDVSEQSNKKVWWVCEHGHEWQAHVSNRSKGHGCPFCGGKKVIVGETDLATVNPVLAAQWHPIKNGELYSTDVSEQSNKKVWWVCEHGHEWQAHVSNRSKGHGCPFCGGKKVIVGKTDLATVNPVLATQWHPIKNGELYSTDVSKQSHKKVWWVCEHGHEWQATVKSRFKGRGCPYCYGRIAIEGETDLATVNPVLAAQLHPTKNGNLKAIDVTEQSGKKVWWLCDHGHEWRATVIKRSYGNDCPFCSGRRYSPNHI